MHLKSFVYRQQTLPFSILLVEYCLACIDDPYQYTKSIILTHFCWFFQKSHIPSTPSPPFVRSRLIYRIFDKKKKMCDKLMNFDFFFFQFYSLNRIFVLNIRTSILIVLLKPKGVVQMMQNGLNLNRNPSDIVICFC